MLSYKDTLFIRKCVSGNVSKYYYESRNSAGIFAITPEMVDSLGVPSGCTFIRDLTLGDKDPYQDFRFTNSQAYSFVCSFMDGLKCHDPILKKLAMAYCIYIDKTKVQYCLDILENKNKVMSPIILLSAFGSLLSEQVTDQYSLFLITTLRHTYISQLGLIA